MTPEPKAYGFIRKTAYRDGEQDSEIQFLEEETPPITTGQGNYAPSVLIPEPAEEEEEPA